MPSTVEITCPGCTHRKKTNPDQITRREFTVNAEDIKKTKRGSPYISFKCPEDNRTCPKFLKKEFVSSILAPPTPTDD